MRSLALLLIATIAPAQSALQLQLSHTTESLRGVSVVSRDVAWASGTHGTYLRTTDGGHTWTPAQVPDASTLDFRAVVAFSADDAFLMSAGPGDQSRIYHTADAGQHWQLQFKNSNAKGFFDSMAFWDPKHGIVLGDPIPDDSGKLKFELLTTDDGQTWRQLQPSQLPPAIEGEGAFAASNSCISILPTPAVILSSHRTPPRDDQSMPPQAVLPMRPDPNLWFATGGKVARVFHSPDRGKTWHVFDTPIVHGPDSAGIFSIAFRDTLHGVIAGGDYKKPNQDGPNLAFTNDGGKTWTLSPVHPLAYFSAVTHEQRSTSAAASGSRKKVPARTLRLFVVAQEFVLDLHPPNRWQRVGAKRTPVVTFNAVSSYPTGGALLVGPNGSIAAIQ
jgi:photosystem II stability/assembly factor-like uncharacterized protein